MKKYILLYALCFASSQLQAMTIKDIPFSDSLVQSTFGLELPEVPVINNPFVQLAVFAGVSVGALLVAVATDYSYKQDRQLILHDDIKENRHWGAKVTLLLGADPYRKVFSKDGLATTAIHEAVKHHAVEFLTLFLARNGDIDVQNSHGQTALHLASISNEEQARVIIQALVARGACLQAADIDGNSPLHLAVQNDAASAALQVLELKADVNAQDYEGFTPLHNAALDGNIPLITLLLQHGARTDILTEGQISTWELADQNNREAAAQMLLNAEEQRRLWLHVSPHGINKSEKLIYRELNYK